MMIANFLPSSLRLAVWLGMLLAVNSLARAQVVSVDFAANQPEGQRLSSTDVAGVVAVSNWNTALNSNGGGIALLDNTGAPSGAALSTYFSNNAEDFIPPVDPNTTELLFSSYIETQFSGNVGFSVINIPYAVYDLYVYVMSGNSGRQGYVSTTEAGTPDYYYRTAGGVPDTFTQVTSTSSASYTTGNYVLFEGLTASSQTVTLNGLNSWSGISGFQVRAVPEPATSALAAGALALLALRRRRDA